MSVCSRYTATILHGSPSNFTRSLTRTQSWDNRYGLLALKQSINQSINSQEHWAGPDTVCFTHIPAKCAEKTHKRNCKRSANCASKGTHNYIIMFHGGHSISLPGGTVITDSASSSKLTGLIRSGSVGGALDSRSKELRFESRLRQEHKEKLWEFFRVKINFVLTRCRCAQSPRVYVTGNSWNQALRVMPRDFRQ